MPKYNADTQAFEVYRSLFNSNFPFSLAYGMSDIDIEFFGDGGYYNRVELEISRSSKIIGTYEASNAYGATTTVTEYHIVSKLVFDNKGRHRMGAGDDLFEERKEYASRTLEIPVPLADAPQTKKTLEMVALIDPKEPFYTTLRYYDTPDMEYPTEKNGDAIVLIADIQCIGAIDGDGNLLASWKTR